MPIRASCGWTCSPVVQRRNSLRCWSRARVLPRKPLSCVAASVRVGLTRTMWCERAKRKNCRRTTSLRLWALGKVVKKASMSCTSARASAYDDSEPHSEMISYAAR